MGATCVVRLLEPPDWTREDDMAKRDPGQDPTIPDDVEGHTRSTAETEPTEDDDVGGHMMGGEISPDIYGDSRRTP